MKSMLISGKTHPGRRRKDNQDAFIYRRLWTADKALLAVIDGVGGYAGGEKAAAIAKNCIEQYMQIPRGDTLAMLREAVVFANNSIVEERKKDQHISEMCCVLTAVVADTAAKHIYYAHVGDTRLYRYRNGSLQKLTRDHSFVGLKEDAGEITELEAMNHPQRNQILREVGSVLHRLDDEDFMDYGREDFLPGDLLLLCSDGLTDMVTAQQMITLLSAGQSVSGKVNNLVALANEMGGHDNITVLLLQQQQQAMSKEEMGKGVIGDKAMGKAVTPEVENKPTVEPVKTVITKTKPPATEKSKLLWAVLLLLTVAAASLYLTVAEQTSAQRIRPTAQALVDHAADSNRTVSTINTVRPAIPGPKEKTDTLRITTTQNLYDVEHYADSIGKTLILLPAKKNNNRFAAIEITKRSAKPGDTILVKNLRLKDFETGINVRVPVLLKTENLVFENIRYPFSYLFKPGNSSQPVLLTNTAKH